MQSMIKNFDVYKQFEWLWKEEIVEKISDFLLLNKDVIDKILLESDNKDSCEQKIQTSDLVSIKALWLCALGFLYDIKDSNNTVEELIETIRQVQNAVKIMLDNRR